MTPPFSVGQKVRSTSKYGPIGLPRDCLGTVLEVSSHLVTVEFFGGLRFHLDTKAVEPVGREATQASALGKDSKSSQDVVVGVLQP